jgi:uncharacterized membrane protein YgdD (TMEM256/DUF423 family)
MPHVFADLAADDSAIVVAVVAARLLVPLLIPRFPLVILVALVLDAADNTVLDRFTQVDLSESGPYQSWDKALDVYYLAIAYLSTMRNWTSDAAFRVCQFLFYYRLVGVVLFELLDSRAMLLIFPNSFEYFFIVYEVIRLRYEPSRCSARFWLILAAVIWVFVKLPQEYWIHIAQRDVTDAVSEHPALGIAVAIIAAAALAVLLVVARPRLPAPDPGWRIAADELPASIDDASAQHARRLRRSRVLWGELVEQICLLALLCVIFAEILPGVGATPLQVTLGVVAIVCANTAISMGFARSGRTGIESAATRFAALVAANLALVFLASLILTDSADFQLGAGLFFGSLITLIVWLYDVYKPVYDVRFDGSPLRVASVADLRRRVGLAAP